MALIHSSRGNRGSKFQQTLPRPQGALHYTRGEIQKQKPQTENNRGGEMWDTPLINRTSFM